MVTVIRARRRSSVLTPSTLACLSTIPTINLTAGCLHNCAYCYTRGYSIYPGQGRIVFYEDTLEKLRAELDRRHSRPHAVYFSPSSDLFQPLPEVLELGRAILEYLLSQGIGVAFLTKGRIPDDTMRLLTDHAALVRAQVGLITLDEAVVRAFEPNAASPQRRLAQLEALIAGGIAAEARLDPILPTLTDTADSLGRLLAALAQVGVKRVAAGVLFLRPAILRSLQRSVPDGAMLTPLLDAYRGRQSAVMTGSPCAIETLPREARREIFARLREAAQAHGIEGSVCGCKNADLEQGSCNIAGTWSTVAPQGVQLALMA